MAIRPLFEQRKEGDAQIAREILAHRSESDRAELSSATTALASDDSAETEPHDNVVDAKRSGSRASRLRNGTPFVSPTNFDDDDVVQEFTAIKFVSPRSADAKAHDVDVTFGHVNEYIEQALESATTDTAESDLQSADNADVLHDATPIDASLTSERGSSLASPDEASVTHDHEQVDAVADVSSTPSLLAHPLVPGHYHEPFRVVESDHVALRVKDARSSLNNQSDALDLHAKAATATRHAAPVLYKELWSERNRFDDCSATVTVLLSSEATVSIAIANVTTLIEPSPEVQDVRDPLMIRVTDADIALSKQLRPNLRALTRQWAAWLLTRVARDSHGTFFLQLYDAPALEQCYADASVSLDGSQLRVGVHVVGDTSLLVSVADAASGATSKLFLNERELQALAVGLGRALSDTDASSVDVASLIRDHAFLAQIVTKSSVVRLGRKSSEVSPPTLVHAMHYSSTDDALDSAHDDAAHTPELKDGDAQQDALPSDLRSLLHANSSLGAVAFLARAHATEAMASVLRHVQQREAVQLHAQNYVLQHAASANSAAFSDFIAATVGAAKLAKLTVRRSSCQRLSALSTRLRVPRLARAAV